MLESLFTQNENKTLEFKENTKSLTPIIKTVIAFANTAGGNIVIGIRDKNKKIIGIKNVLLEEERLANAIADSIEPLIIPHIQILSFRDRELLIIQVPHMAGPFCLKSAGLERGVYVRLGSTNRLADSETILSLQMLAKNVAFDELPCIGASPDDINCEIVKNSLLSKLGEINKKQYESLDIVIRQTNKLLPTNAGILLFSANRFKWFPDSSILCVSFSGETREEIIDQQEIRSPLISAYEEILSFIKKNTKISAKIGEGVREDTPQYPAITIREAVINAIVHADYSLKGTTTQIAIFSNRIEITNPGGLTYGQTMELALSGISRMRNRVMGRIFREVKLIERLGTGLKRILSIYQRLEAKTPLFQELNTHFRVTLYSIDVKQVSAELSPWEKDLILALKKQKRLGTTDIAKIWNVTARTARNRLKKMIESDLISRVATSLKDPYAVFKLK